MRFAKLTVIVFVLLLGGFLNTLHMGMACAAEMAIQPGTPMYSCCSPVPAPAKHPLPIKHFNCSSTVSQPIAVLFYKLPLQDVSFSGGNQSFKVSDLRFPLLRPPDVVNL